jgi:hypothetical protein
MNFLNLSDSQEPLYKIWCVIMRNLHRNEAIEDWKTVGMKGMKVIELFTISAVLYPNDEVIIGQNWI